MILRRIFYALAVLIAGFVVLLIATKGTHTPAFTDANGNPVPDSIAEERIVTLGGVDQYVLLRGLNKRAPLLLYVHGGPGMTSTPFLRTYNEQLEDHFLVVYWEQRGTSNSFSEDLNKSSMTIDQITNDLSELVDLMLAEFQQEEVLLVGHSWGTIPALEYSAESPNTVAAYIAVAQTTNQVESDKQGFEWALAKAQEKALEKSVNVLQNLGTPPYTYDEFVTQRKQVNFLGGGTVEAKSDLDFAFTAVKSAEFAWPKLGSLVKGVQFSGAALWEEQQQYDAFKRHPKLDVPVFMLSGRHDRIISPALASAYFDALDASEKEFIWFEESAHAPQFEEPELFNSTIIEIAKQIGLLSP